MKRNILKLTMGAATTLFQLSAVVGVVMKLAERGAQYPMLPAIVWLIAKGLYLLVLYMRELESKRKDASGNVAIFFLAFVFIFIIEPFCFHFTTISQVSQEYAKPITIGWIVFYACLQLGTLLLLNEVAKYLKNKKNSR